MVVKENAQELPQLRAFIDERKTGIRAAEAQYNIEDAKHQLRLLAGPLVRPTEYEPSWKGLYLRHFYRTTCDFILQFVVVHLDACFAPRDRADCLDVFFDQRFVPAHVSLDTLLSFIQRPATLHGEAQQDGITREATDDHAQLILRFSVRVIQAQLLHPEAMRGFFLTLLEDPQAQQELRRRQPLLQSLVSLPDLVYNRLELRTPRLFAPSAFCPLLVTSLFQALLQTPDGAIADARGDLFRIVSEKICRIGQAPWLVQGWLEATHDCADEAHVRVHQQLLSKLASSSYEPLLVALASDKSLNSGSCDVNRHVRLRNKLVALFPESLVEAEFFQHVLTRKLILSVRVRDFTFWIALIDRLAHVSADAVAGDSLSCSLEKVFDVVVTRWSTPGFASQVDYHLNESICFFLRYAMDMMSARTDQNGPWKHSKWIVLLTKGIQDHMAHSVQRVRVLAMRMAESLSKVVSPENLLKFDIEEDDPIDVALNQLKVSDESEEEVQSHDADATKGTRVTRRGRHRPVQVFVDPDAPVSSDDDCYEEISDDDAANESDPESDLSLEPYDLEDDEEDLKAPRPMYLKDLLTALQAENERERTERALAEAETLLRRMPRDLQYQAKDVVAALLRLEDRYSTPNFDVLRAKALAAACALAPRSTAPYLISQALEKEQLLQSRIDVIQAMVKASHELAGIEDFAPVKSKKLLQEDLSARTMQGLRTRRWGYRRDAAPIPTRNRFADHAMEFFGPLLMGYVDYAQSFRATNRSMSDLEHYFLAHVIHALASFVESAGHAPCSPGMAKLLLEFVWQERKHSSAAVRRQVAYAFSRALLVVPSFMLRQELAQPVMEFLTWAKATEQSDPDPGCREACKLLLSMGIQAPSLVLPS